MENIYSKEDKIAFHKKMHQLFSEVLVMDWTPDKGYKASFNSNNMIQYVSVSKLKRQLVIPVCSSGLNFNVEFVDPILLNESTVVTALLTFVDVDTGYSETYRSLGAGKGEKALQVAQSFALKAGLMNQFMIVDGIDPENEDGLQSRTGSKFVPKSVDEVSDIKSKIQDNAVPEPKEEPKNEEPKKEEKTDEPYTLSGLEERTINGIVTKWSEKLSKGDVTKEQFNDMMRAKDGANSRDGVLAFIRKYRSM